MKKVNKYIHKTNGKTILLKKFSNTHTCPFRRWFNPLHPQHSKVGYTKWLTSDKQRREEKEWLYRVDIWQSYLTQVSKVNITSDFMWVTCILCHDMVRMRLHHCIFFPKPHHLNLIIVIIIINHTVLNWRHYTRKYLPDLPQNYLKSWKSRQNWYTVTANS